ncbi:MAG TPA: hypothetical protein VHU83_16660 [Bryobacteraceae bacterium]|jgi:hypothetical protein|nr:hypothetical protein [Bryobacteraceae bacterium]
MAEAAAGRNFRVRQLPRIIVSIVLALAVLYIADYLLLRYRVAANRSPYGTVTVQPYYAVPRKDHRTEFMFDDPQDQTCVNSLFPHFGDSPCWYLNRNKQKRINM